jgi:outer membrane biosynthesis protein TonB
VNTSILANELAQLNVQIEQVGQEHDALAWELRVVDAEIQTFATDIQRFDALRDVCSALDKLGNLEASDLFWQGVSEPQNVSVHREQVRNRIAHFDGEISGILGKQASLKGQINQCLDELEILDEEVREAYAREERREEEYVVDREISDVPKRSLAMPWTRERESEKRFRRALRYAFLFYIIFGLVIGLWKLPPPVRPTVAVIPEHLVSMLRKEPPRPEPIEERPKEEKKPEKDPKKTPEKPKEDQPKPTAAEKQVARKKAQSTGVLAFKDAFKDIMDETPSARLGAEAHLSNQAGAASGQAQASRSLVAMPSSGGGSGGISYAGVSRNIGSGNGNRIGGVGFARVESSVSGLTEGTRALSSGPGPARTDEEIQIVFDKYKAALYRMYNAELRRDPTLRGRILMRITIEPGGEVSACTVQSSELTSPELVAQVVERVRKFNFGPKEKVPKTTILYPIDFLPAG